MSDVLNIDLASWDSASPVLLPLGALPLGPIVAASMGVLVPFIIFAFAMFMHTWNMWDDNLQANLSDFGRTRLEKPSRGTTNSFASYAYNGFATRT